MLARFVQALERLIFGHRVAVLAALAAVTLVMGVFAARLHMNAGFGKQLPLGHEYTETFVKYRDVLFGANRLIVVVKARQGDVWQPKMLKRLNEVTQAVLYLPGVDRRSVSSLWTPNTRVMQVTHMLHWTGRVLPAQRLCEMARERGVLSLVDGAQTFAQMPVSFRSLACDFFVTSLHKWLGAPVGNGMLIVHRDRIASTWSLMAPFDAAPDRIDKFDHWNLGTYNSALQAGIAPAVEIYREVGAQAMHARLRELTRYWGASSVFRRSIALFRERTDTHAGI